MADRPTLAMRDAVVEIAPMLLGVFPFGVIAGIAAVDAGLTTLQAIAHSPIIFAGASQLAATGLIAQDATPAVIILTALVINSRMAMYSASLAPWWRGLGAWRTVGAAYLLTDQAFAMSVVRYDRIEETLRVRMAYYFGAALSLWATWQTATVVGVIVGTEVPPEWSLDFAIPLVFLALVFPAIKDRPTATAALSAAVSAVALNDLPLHLGLPTSAVIGVGVGLFVDLRREGKA